MKDDQDYIKDITEIRTMMERSTKFLSLSGWAGIMAGLYALAGAWIAWNTLDPAIVQMNSASIHPEYLTPGLLEVVLVALTVLILAIVTAVLFSMRNAKKRGEKLWNATSRRLVIYMSVPLIAGGLLILILISKGLLGLIAPVSLLFYGLALYNASKFTYEEVRSLGLIEIGIGLFSAYFTEYGFLCWALGFGVIHIIYGIYMHYKYER